MTGSSRDCTGRAEEPFALRSASAANDLNTTMNGGLKISPTVQAGPGSHWRCGISDLSSPRSALRP
jgi:hypothetical protein